MPGHSLIYHDADGWTRAVSIIVGITLMNFYAKSSVRLVLICKGEAYKICFLYVERKGSALAIKEHVHVVAKVLPETSPIP